MSGGKVGGDTLGFTLTEVAIELIIAGGAAALVASREAAEYCKVVRESEEHFRARRQALKAEGERHCHIFEQQLESDVRVLAAGIERATGKKVTARLANETVFASYTRLKQEQNENLFSRAKSGRFAANPLKTKKLFEEVTAIAVELLPYEWKERHRVEEALEKAKKALCTKNGDQQELIEAITCVRDEMRVTRKRHLSQINRVESLRRQYLEELATARALYAIMEEQIVVEDFCFDTAEAQIANLQRINNEQRMKLDLIYEDPTYAMTPEARKQAVCQVSDRIGAAMKKSGNKLVGDTVSPNAITRFYRYGNAFLRCSVAENGTVMMEVVGDTCGDGNVGAVVEEMERFKGEFEDIQNVLKEHGVDFTKYGEYAPCAEAVEFFNVKGDSRQGLQETGTNKVMYHEEM